MSIKDNAPDIILGILRQKDEEAFKSFTNKDKKYRRRILIVEGILDQNIYGKLVFWKEVQIINVSTIFYKLNKSNPNVKEAIIETMRRIREEEIKFKKIKVLAIVDRDFDYKDAKNEYNLIFTDTSDLETLLIKTHAFDFKNMPGMIPNRARSIYCMAYELGIIRQEMFNMVNNDIVNIRYYFSETAIKNNLSKIINQTTGVVPKTLLDLFAQDKENKLYKAAEEYKTIFYNNLINHLKDLELLNSRNHFKFDPTSFIKSEIKDYWLNIRGHDVFALAFKICKVKEDKGFYNKIHINKFIADNTNINYLVDTTLFKELSTHSYAFFDLVKSSKQLIEDAKNEKDFDEQESLPTKEPTELQTLKGYIKIGNKIRRAHQKTLEECNLSARTINCLKRAGYKNEDMVKQEDKDVLRNIKNMSTSMYYEILIKIFNNEN